MTLAQRILDALQDTKRQDAAQTTAVQREDPLGRPFGKMLVQCQFTVGHGTCPSVSRNEIKPLGSRRARKPPLRVAVGAPATILSVTFCPTRQQAETRKQL